MLTVLILASLFGLGDQQRPRIPPPIQAQQPHPAPILPGQADLPVVWGATESPACGGFDGVAEVADCVSAPLDTIAAVAQSYVPLLEQRGYHWVGGEANQYLFARPLGNDSCDFLTMTAFYDTTLQESATGAATGWLGFAMIGAHRCNGAAPQPATGISAGAAPGQPDPVDAATAPDTSDLTPYQSSPNEIPYQSSPQ